MFYSLVHFPAIHKSIEFSDDRSHPNIQPRLTTRTKEGLELDISFAFQYQIQKETLPQMYRMCQDDYEAIYIKIARNAVLQIAGDYNASDYWLNRSHIGVAMHESLR